jgi:hypothetical protein
VREPRPSCKPLECGVATIKGQRFVVDSLLMQESPFVHIPETGDPFGTPRRSFRPTFGGPQRQLRRAGVVVGIALVVLARVFLLVDGASTARTLLRAVSGYPSCVAAGIDSAGGREGTCVEGPLWSQTTVKVVDHVRTLQMPQYAVRLVHTRIAPTRVHNAAQHPQQYPNGFGELISYYLAVTNTTDRPLLFGLGGAYERRASYPLRSPPVELFLPESTNPSDGYTVSYPPLIEGVGAPEPSILQQAPISPGETRFGWVSFVAAGWAQSVLTMPGADVDFYKTTGQDGYRGSIRLWK